jgi:hypothetical protein
MTFLEESSRRVLCAGLALMAAVAAAMGAVSACSSGGSTNSSAKGSSSPGGSSSGVAETSSGAASSGGAPASSATGSAAGAGSSGSGGDAAAAGSLSGGGSAAGGSDAGSCVTAISPVLINFENYNPMSDAGFETWFGGGSSVGYIGPYAYSGGGPDGGVNWTLSPVTGRTGGEIDGGQDWAIDFHLTQESVFGGALAFWMTCVNASAYKGISFWARGQTPTGTCPADAGGGSCFSFSFSTEATSVAADGGAGTCMGTSATCVGPQANNLPLSMVWTEYQIPWSQFAGGLVDGTAYTPNGQGIVGMTFSVGLTWGELDASADGAAIYGPTPANIDLQIDDIGFMQ